LFPTREEIKEITREDRASVDAAVASIKRSAAAVEVETNSSVVTVEIGLEDQEA